MGIRLLVVDDSAVVRQGLRFMLTHAGMEVAEATCCCDVRRVIAQFEFDCVLLEIALPDDDGFKVLADMQATRPELPVLVYSLDNRRSYIAKSHCLGACGFLVKGLENDAILEAIRCAVDGKAVWTAAQLATIISARQNEALRVTVRSTDNEF